MFHIVAALVLALGIGLNLVQIHVYLSLSDRLREVRDPLSLYRLSWAGKGRSLQLSKHDYDSLASRSSAFTDLLSESRASLTVTTGATFAKAGLVSGNYFTALGTQPAIGRLLMPSDVSPGGPHVAVLSYWYWQRNHAADPSVIGQAVLFNRRPVEVVGVAPPGFDGLSLRQTAVWLPFTMSTVLSPSERCLDCRELLVFGRLRPGLSKATVDAELQIIAASIRDQIQDSGSRQYRERIQVDQVDSGSFDTRMALMMVVWMCLVLLVFFTACANVGNMILSRGIIRTKELETRVALGCTATRLIRQLMIENLLLALLSAAFALVIGHLGTQALWYVADGPQSASITTDWRIIIAVLIMAVGATFTFGLAPSAAIVRQGLRNKRTPQIMVGVQVASSCVLLIVASLLRSGMQHYLSVDVPFDYQNMAVLDLGLDQLGVAAGPARERIRSVVERVDSFSGVNRVTYCWPQPFGPGMPAQLVQTNLRLHERWTDRSYFSVMNLRLIRGRSFTSEEKGVVVISESTANAIRGRVDGDVLGRSMDIASEHQSSGATRITVVGVVEDSRAFRKSDPGRLEIYLPFGEEGKANWAPGISRAAIIVHTSKATRVSTILPALLEAAVADSDERTATARPLVKELETRVERQKILLSLVSALGGITTFLAAVGVFSVVSLTVAQKTKEIGIRMALGASPLNVMVAVLGQHRSSLLVGSAIGVVLSVFAALAIRPSLWGLSVYHPWSYCAGFLLWLITTVGACLVPIARAVRIEPAIAVRD